jgi:hypothetical protein
VGQGGWGGSVEEASAEMIVVANGVCTAGLQPVSKAFIRDR